jgi:hypothetical protein
MYSKFLVSLGGALAASRIVQSIAQLEANDVLRRIGLARRRSHAVENLALIGLGALAGAGVALLLAPSAGSETRQRVASELGKVKDATVSALRDVRHQAPNMLQHFREASNNEVSPPNAT